MRKDFASSTLLIVSVALFSGGCGKGEYDKLMATRVERLQNPAKYNILVWQEHKNPDLQYFVTMPKGLNEEVTQEDGEGVRSETRELVLSSTRYRFRFSKYESTDGHGEGISNAVEEQYRQLGYEDIPAEEVTVAPISPSQSIKTLNLRHPDEAIGRARVEIVEYNSQSVCTMEVLGTEIDEAICGKFFKSAKPTFSRRRRGRRR